MVSKSWLLLSSRSSFFSKCLKFDVDSRNGTKNSERAFGFKDTCIGIGDKKFLEPRKRYFSFAVNVLRNTPKILHITKRYIFQIKLSQSDEKI